LKREPEELDGLVSDALRRLGPITAYALAASLRERGHPMTEIQAYRVLKRLIARGQVRHIWLGRRYAAHPPADPSSLALVCRACARTRFTAAPQVQADLRGRAATLEFCVGEIVLEVSGLCDQCLP
jgi:Fur family transcriptional regulator, zinc uptake regulator